MPCSVPPPLGPKIFLSAARHELAGVREAVAREVGKLGGFVQPPMDQIADATVRLRELPKRIAEADAVVLLVGLCAGEVPPIHAVQTIVAEWNYQSPGISQALGLGPGDHPSYVQLEARVAFAIRKPVHVFILSDDFPFGRVAPEPAALMESQEMHRRILSQTGAATSVNSLTGLRSGIRELPLFANGSQRTQSMVRSRILRLSAIALITAVVCAVPLSVWTSQLKIKQEPGAAVATAPLAQLPSPQELIFEIAAETLKATLPGDYATAEERVNRAAAAVAQRAGVDLGTLKATTLQPWVGAAMGKAVDKPYDLCLALFWMKDYRSARKSAVKAYEGSPVEKLGNNMEQYRACIVAAASAYANGDIAGANEELQRSMTFPHRREIKGTKEEVTALMEADYADGVWESQRRAFFTQMIDGMHRCNATWDTKFSHEAAVTSMPPEDVVTVVIRYAQELATGGKFLDAAKVAEQAVRAAEVVHGRDSWHAVLVLCAQAGILKDSGNLREANAVLARAARIQERHFAADELLKATVLHSQALVALELGRARDAGELAKLAYELRLKKFGPQDPATFECMSTLGMALRDQGKVDKALEVLAEVRASTEQLMGKENFFWLIATRNHADVLRLKGQLEPAYEQLTECHKLQYRLQLMEKVEGALTIDSLGLVCRELGRLHDGSGWNDVDGNAEGSRAYHMEAVATLQKVLGSRHRVVARAMAHLGTAEYDTENYGRAEKTLRDALALHEAQQDPAPSDVAETLYFLGRCLGQQERDSESIPILQRSVEMYQDIFHEPAVPMAMALHSLARSHSGTGNSLEAHGLHSRAEEMLGRCTSEDHPARSRTHLMIGATLQEEGRDREAFERFALAWTSSRRSRGIANLATAFAWRVMCECALGTKWPMIPPQPTAEEGPEADVVAKLRLVREALEKSRVEYDSRRTKTVL